MGYLRGVKAGQRVKCLVSCYSKANKNEIYIVCEGSSEGDVHLMDLRGNSMGYWSCYEGDFEFVKSSKFKDKLTEYIREKDR